MILKPYPENEIQMHDKHSTQRKSNYAHVYNKYKKSTLATDAYTYMSAMTTKSI